MKVLRTVIFHLAFTYYTAAEDYAGGFFLLWKKIATQDFLATALEFQINTCGERVVLKFLSRSAPLYEFRTLSVRDWLTCTFMSSS